MELHLYLKPDPLGYPRNPLAVYLLGLALLSGLLFVAGVPTSRSVEDTLPYLARMAWSVLLVLGSTSALGGMYWPGQVGTGLLLKRTGMFTLAVTGALYALVLAVALGLPALLNSGLVLGFAVACWLQYRAINVRVHEVLAASRKAQQ